MVSCLFWNFISSFLRQWSHTSDVVDDRHFNLFLSYYALCYRALFRGRSMYRPFIKQKINKGLRYKSNYMSKKFIKKYRAYMREARMNCIFVWQERGRTRQMERIISPVVHRKEKQRQKNHKCSEEMRNRLIESRKLRTFSVHKANKTSRISK